MMSSTQIELGGSLIQILPSHLLNLLYMGDDKIHNPHFGLYLIVIIMTINKAIKKIIISFFLKIKNFIL